MNMASLWVSILKSSGTHDHQSQNTRQQLYSLASAFGGGIVAHNVIY